ILNPAPVRDLDGSVWPLVDYLTPNESEAARLGGVSVAGPEEAAAVGRALRARGARAVIVTLGARGALASGPAGDLVVPAFPVTAVDTTAAGDAFNGALAVGLAEGAALWPALRLATAAAAPVFHRAAERGERGDGGGPTAVEPVVADQQQVDARADRLHHGLGEAVVGPDRAHAQVVRDDDARPPDLLAQEPGQRGGRQRGRE